MQFSSQDIQTQQKRKPASIQPFPSHSFPVPFPTLSLPFLPLPPYSFAFRFPLLSIFLAVPLISVPFTFRPLPFPFHLQSRRFSSPSSSLSFGFISLSRPFHGPFLFLLVRLFSLSFSASCLRSISSRLSEPFSAVGFPFSSASEQWSKGYFSDKIATNAIA